LTKVDKNYIVKINKPKGVQMINRARENLRKKVGEDHLLNPLEMVRTLTEKWREREREIITARAGLFTENYRRMTLDALGKRYRLSRERVRQIERDAAKKLNKALEDFFAKEKKVLIEAIEAFGGIAGHHHLLELLTNEKTPEQNAALKVLYSALPEVQRLPLTKHNRLGWTTKNISLVDLHSLLAGFLAIIDKAGKIVPIEELVKKHPKKNEYDFEALLFLPLISQKLIVFPKTDSKPIRVAVRPKNISDKIDFVLREAGEPLHFREIARRIREVGFDSKRVLPETVHNELIADGRFALVGRGVYALKEWRLLEGPVYKVIENVLKAAKEPLGVDEITKRVTQLRNVKKGTILVNLQTKPLFKKVGKGIYTLAS